MSDVIPAPTPPPNYLVWGILATVLCCLPVGIVSIIFSTQVNSKWAAGDVAGANQASQWALWCAIGAAVLGVIIVVVFAAIAILSSIGGAQGVPIG
jgi:hypothetical protein